VRVFTRAGFLPLLRRNLVVLLIVAACAATGHAAGTRSADGTWQLVSEKEGIKVYMRHGEGSRLKTFRGVTTLSVDDWHALAGVINDYANAPRWLHFVSAVQELGRRGPLDRDVIFQTDLPWPVNDREAVVRAHGWNPPGTYDTVIRFENAPTLLPPNGDFVRFPEFNARFDFHWAGGNRMEVTYELVADPGGYIPDWIANIVLKDAPYFTLKRLAKTIQRPEYQGKHYDYIVTPPGYGARTK
jgi:hypothetical protein